MSSAVRVSLAASGLLLAATLGKAQTPALTPAQQSALEARIALLAKLRNGAAPASAGVPVGAIDAQVASINENSFATATSRSSSLNFSLTFAAAGLDPASAVRKVRLTRAVDNLDRPLTSTASQIVTVISSIPTLLTGRGGAPGLRGSGSFTELKRDALSIKILEGEVELFTPSPDNGSVVRISDLAGQIGKTIDHPALGDAGVEFTLLDRERYDSLMATLATQAATAPAPNFSTSLFILVRSSGGRLVNFEIQNADGARLGTQGSLRPANGGYLMEVRLGAPLPADAALVLRLAVPDSIKTYTFKVENVALP